MHCLEAGDAGQPCVLLLDRLSKSEQAQAETLFCEHNVVLRLSIDLRSFDPAQLSAVAIEVPRADSGAIWITEPALVR